MSFPVLECMFCKCGFTVNETGGPYTCKAFPKGIPDEITSGKQRHRQTIPGQVGNFVFDCKEDTLYYERWKKSK